MLTRFAATTALCLTLGMGAAFAQGTQSNQNMQGTTAQTNQNMQGTTAQTTTAPGGQLNVMTQQQPDQMLADDVMGENVYNAQNENVGEVNDLVIDKSGRVVAIVVGVGGFLGIGERDVAIPFEQVQVLRGQEARQAAATRAPATTGTTGTTTTTSPSGTTTTTTGTGGTAATNTTGADMNDLRLVINTTRDQLKNMPAFVSLEDQNRRGNTTTTTGTTTAPPANTAPPATTAPPANNPPPATRTQ